MDAYKVLILGDGDFSFSLDFARYLASIKSHKIISTKANTSSLEHLYWPADSNFPDPTLRPWALTATGIDSRIALEEKYKNCSHILREIENVNKTSKNVSTTVLHDFNAIVRTDVRTDLVIFNYPHLGTENAHLHSLFLMHLFHTVKTSWTGAKVTPQRDTRNAQLPPLFLLTLADGQYERWQCELAAERHGFTILQKLPFQPPRDSKYYEQRRHQSGKAFKRRVEKCGVTVIATLSTCQQQFGNAKFTQLPWTASADFVSNKDAKAQYSCPHCERSFAEERSLNNHINGKHGVDENNRKRKLDETLLCTQCNPHRPFTCTEALNDHILAKHSLHVDKIRPDWSKTDKCGTTDTTVEKDTDCGVCNICNAAFRTKDEATNHIQYFDPTYTTNKVESNNYVEIIAISCSFCSRPFRDERAKLQHENFCKNKNRPALQDTAVASQTE